MIKAFRFFCENNNTSTLKNHSQLGDRVDGMNAEARV
jgi:hypothetical protein